MKQKNLPWIVLGTTIVFGTIIFFILKNNKKEKQDETDETIVGETKDTTTTTPPQLKLDLTKLNQTISNLFQTGKKKPIMGDEKMQAKIDAQKRSDILERAGASYQKSLFKIK